MRKALLGVDIERQFGDRAERGDVVDQLIAEAVLSIRPREAAKPPLVVASAGNPRPWRSRQEPGSNGFGITKIPASCKERKRLRASSVGMTKG